jgi:hypothetical protein
MMPFMKCSLRTGRVKNSKKRSKANARPHDQL